MQFISKISYRHWSAAFGAALITAVFLTGCGKKEAANANSNAKNPTTVQIQAAQVELRQVGRYIDATGNLVADESSNVASQVSGKVISTPAGIGQYVNQGDVLITLDARDSQFRLQQAQGAQQQAVAAVRQAQARLGLGEGGKFDPNTVPEVLAANQTYLAALAQVKNAEAQVENLQAQAKLAEDTARRYGNLYRSGDASQLFFAQKQTEAEAAGTQVKAARENVNALRAQSLAGRRQYEAAINNAKQGSQGIEAAQAQLKNTETQISIEQKAIDDATIHAPFSGFISERPVAVGEFITSQTSLATIVRNNPIKVNLQIPEAEARNARVGMNVSATVAAYPERQFAGTVTAISPSLEEASRAVTVEAQIENGENLLRPNMFAQAKILQSGGDQGVFVPKSAISTDKNTSSSRVYKINNDGTARLVIVQIGEEEGAMIRVVNGLEGSEKVAVTGTGQLFDGAPVEIVAGK